MPYSSHNKVPTVNIVYMDNEMLDVSFDRMVFMACGRNEKVVQAAARRPIMVISCTGEFYAM